MTPEIERLIGTNATANQIGTAARASGMTNLFDSGLRHALGGDTSIDELLRVTEVPQAASAAPDSSVGSAARPRAAGAVASAEEVLEGLELLEESGPHAIPGLAPPRATILLVEDEDTLRRVMKDLLEQEGYVICEARDGAEALEQVDRHNPDIVLLDLNLPNVDGYTVLSQLRSRPHTADLPIVVLSARGDEDNEVRVLRLGATDFLTKPFRPRALSARLEAALARRRA